MCVACYRQFFSCTHASCLCFKCARVYPNTDTCITHHVFVHNRNKIVLEMLLSFCFTCDEGELQTAWRVSTSFNCHPRFNFRLYGRYRNVYVHYLLSSSSGDPVSCCINNQSYGCWNEEQIKVAVTKQCTGTRSCMVIEICLYGLNDWVWVYYLWLASAFNKALWFYKHSIPSTLRICTCTQSHHIYVYLHFSLSVVHFTCMSSSCDTQHAFNFWLVCICTNTHHKYTHYKYAHTTQTTCTYSTYTIHTLYMHAPQIKAKPIP